MQLIQSFIYSITRVRLSLYEQRILLKVVEHAQIRLKGMLIKDHLERLNHDFDNVQICVPIKELLDDGNQHYHHVHSAAVSLCSRTFEFYNSESRTWFATPVIYNVEHRDKSGLLTFYVSRVMFDIILDFTKGYRSYNLKTALSIPSPYASRLYSLMCGQDQPIRFQIKQLKEMFGVTDKYGQTADFIKKVIEPSKRILDAQGCTSFTYSRVKEGVKVVALLFFPVRRQEDVEHREFSKAPVGVFLTKELRYYLMAKAHFSVRELGAHKELIAEFAKLPDAVAAIMAIYDRFLQGNKNKGYIIAAMRSAVAEFKDAQAVVPKKKNKGQEQEPSLEEDEIALGLVD